MSVLLVIILIINQLRICADKLEHDAHKRLRMIIGFSVVVEALEMRGAHLRYNMQD